MKLGLYSFAENTTDGGVTQSPAERSLAAARSADAVSKQPPFVGLDLPAFDVTAIDKVLQLDLPGIEAKTTTIVQAHLASIGDRAESWIGDGMLRIPAASSRLLKKGLVSRRLP